MTLSFLPPLGVDLPLLMQVAQEAIRAHLARHPAQAQHSTLHYQPDLPVALDLLLGTQLHDGDVLVSCSSAVLAGLRAVAQSGWQQ